MKLELCSNKQQDFEHPQEHELGERVSLSVADFRNLIKVAAIPDDASVELKLGNASEISAFGKRYDVRQTKFRGMVPGSTTPLPPVHFVTKDDFMDMNCRAGAFAEDALGVQAWFCEIEDGKGVVEIPVRAEADGSVPKHHMLSGRELKKLIASLYHEFAHTAGAKEYLAHKTQGDIIEQSRVDARRMLVNLLFAFRGHLEIPRYLQKLAFKERFQRRL